MMSHTNIDIIFSYLKIENIKDIINIVSFGSFLFYCLVIICLFESIIKDIPDIDSEMIQMSLFSDI